jgi:hypothetical protein
MPAEPLIEAVAEYLRRDPAGLLCASPDCAYCAWARRWLPASAENHPAPETP